MSPAMGRRVTACCSIQASRTRDREKFTVVPSSSWGSTVVRNWACSLGWAARNCASRPGRTVFTVQRSRTACCVSWSVHKLPRACSPLPRTWLRMASPSLEEWSRSLIIASARLEGIK